MKVRDDEAPTEKVVKILCAIKYSKNVITKLKDIRTEVKIAPKYTTRGLGAETKGPQCNNERHIRYGGRLWEVYR